MRRHEKEITERTAIEEIIRRSLVCRLAMVDNVGQGSWEFASDALQRTVIIKVDIKAMSGKVSGYENT